MPQLTPRDWALTKPPPSRHQAATKPHASSSWSIAQVATLMLLGFSLLTEWNRIDSNITLDQETQARAV